MSFRDTLPEGEAHLARRLEGFGDVVFGFSVSQLALQLSLPQNPTDLVADPIRYILYFGTFFLLAIFWLRFHHVLAGAFRPQPVDLALVMVYLAFIGLVPYALYAVAHNAHSLEGARLGLAAYLIVLLALSLIGAAFQWRNFRRGYWWFDERARFKGWRTFVVTLAIAVVIALCLGIDLRLGPEFAGPSCMLIAVTALASRRLVRIPSAAWLGIAAAPNMNNPVEGSAPPC